MYSRRCLLASFGSAITVSIAGCSSTLSDSIGSTEPEAQRNESALKFDHDFKGDGYRQFRYNVDFQEVEYDYDIFEIAGEVEAFLMVVPEKGILRSMFIPREDFDEKYRESDSLDGMFVKESAANTKRGEGTSEAIDYMQIPKEGEWVLIVDNTEYLGHEPNGRAVGTVYLGIR